MLMVRRFLGIAFELTKSSPNVEQTNAQNMTKIGFIGAGQMATALASGFVEAAKVEGKDVIACDPMPAALNSFASKVPGARTVTDPTECVKQSDVVVLAVKPQHMGSVFQQTGPTSEKTLFISIAAGVTLQRLCNGLNTERVIRVMPNTPCLVGEGAAGFALAGGASPEDGEYVGDLLSAVGVAFQLPEHQLDAVTGLSGSGPAFVYQMIEAMSDGGVRVGLPRAVATKLAAQTLLGAAKMVLETEEHPGLLKDQVTSPGGTTIAGLHQLELGGLRGVLMNAVKSATDRSRELGG